MDYRYWPFELFEAVDLVMLKVSWLFLEFLISRQKLGFRLCLRESAFYGIMVMISSDISSFVSKLLTTSGAVHVLLRSS